MFQTAESAEMSMKPQSEALVKCSSLILHLI